MAVSPAPPRPPAPPQGVHNRSHFVTVALLVLGLIVLVGALALLAGLRFLSSAVHVRVAEARGGNKAVSITTPIGSLNVNKGIDADALGLPIYPGAVELKEPDSASVNIDIMDSTKVRVLAGKFSSPDPVEKIRDFYHERLGGEVTNYKERDAEGKTVFEIKQSNQQRIVALRHEGDHTLIELVRVSEGVPEAN